MDTERNEKARRETEILDVAEELFLQKGFDATTVSAIIERIGIAKGTFYHYFSSKQSLIKALHRRYMEWVLNTLDNALQSSPNQLPTTLLSVWIRTLILGYRESYHLHDIFYGVYDYDHERINRQNNEVLAHLKVILTRGMEAGVWQINCLNVTALLIYAGVHSVTDELIVNQECDEELLIDEVTYAFIKMLQ